MKRAAAPCPGIDDHRARQKLRLFESAADFDCVEQAWRGSAVLRRESNSRLIINMLQIKKMYV
jgi:hypothetical protein